MFQEREEELQKQLKANIGDEFDLSSLTLEESLSPVEEVRTTSSHNKVSPGHCSAAMVSFTLILRVCVCVRAQPVLQYSSAFDDEVEETPEDSSAEMPLNSEGVLECVPEEIQDIVEEGASEAQLDQDEPARQVELSHPPTSTVHGPYYYFYQGE